MLPRPRKGPAKATRVFPIRYRSTEVLTREAEEELFRTAELMLEGAADGDAYFGSLLITIPFERLQPALRVRLDRPAREQLAEVVDASVRVRLRAMRLAREEVAHRLSGHHLGKAVFEIRVSVSELALHLDVDLEVPFQIVAE